MKSKSIFIIFCLLFLAFSFSFMSTWNSAINGETITTRSWVTWTTLLLCAVCFFVFLLVNRRNYRGIHIVTLLWLLIMPVIIFINPNNPIDFFRTLLWPLLFETTYLLCYYDRSRVFFMRYLFVIIAVVGSILFLLTRIDIEKQSNTIYFCLLTLPWLLLFDMTKRKRILLLLGFTFFAFLSLKRSTMLSMSLIWLFYFLGEMKRKGNRFNVALIFIILMIAIPAIYNRIDDNLEGKLTIRVTHEEQDEGNYRMAIWAETIENIKQSSTLELLLGHGHYGVSRVTFLGLSAHNDFLEVIYDYGLMIFLLYLFLWYYVIRRCFLLYRQKSTLFFPYAASLSLFIVLSNVSHLILYTSYFNYLVMFWGMTEAIVEKLQKKVNYKWL